MALGLGAFTVNEIFASKGDEVKNPNYLLILGCRVRGDKAEPTLMMRIEKAAEFLKENESTVAICCGGIVHDDQNISEAEVIRRELIALGISHDRIVLEDKSRTTRENFINAKAIIESITPIERVSLACLSSDFHLLRAEKLALRCGIRASYIAATSPSARKTKNYLRELICMPAVYFDK